MKRHNGLQTEFKKGHLPWNKGIGWSSEVKRKISESNYEYCRRF